MKMKTNKIMYKIFRTFMMLFLIFTSVNSLKAQSEPMYSQYMFNMSAINPAYVGSRGVVNLNYLGRSQWSGITGAPKTNTISIDGSNLKGNMGLGVQVYNDQIGVFKRNGLNLMASSRVKISENGILSGGIQLGVLNQRKNYTDVVNIYDKNDAKFQENKSVTDATLGAGVYYNTDNFYAGVSMPNVLNSTDMNSSGIQKVSIKHLYITAGYVFDLSEDVKIKPSSLMKVVSGAPIEFDFNTNLWLKDMIGLGVSYRTGDAIVGMAELQLNKNLRIGYAYDYTFSALKAFTTGSNEVMFRYEFGKEAKNIKSTRYF
jgi:type IX secretion system PorP/SprF family membrane protein